MVSFPRALTTAYAALGCFGYSLIVSEFFKIPPQHLILPSLGLATLIARAALGAEHRNAVALGGLGAAAALAWAMPRFPTLLPALALVTLCAWVPMGAKPARPSWKGAFHALSLVGGISAHSAVVMKTSDISHAITLLGVCALFGTPSFVGALLQLGSEERAEKALGRGLLGIGVVTAVITLFAGSFGMAIGSVLVFSIPATLAYVLAIPGMVMAHVPEDGDTPPELPIAVTLSKDP